MISILIKDYRGCSRAHIECAPIALLAGLNGAGKTSIAQAVGCVLTGEPSPVAGRGNAGAARVMRDGATSAAIELSSDDGIATIIWPEARRTMDGTPPEASIYAAGLDSIATLTPKERLRILAQYLHADPTRDELAAALKERGLREPQVVDSLWSSIEVSGWDATERLRRERGAEMKGQWRGVTGAIYGSKIAAMWRPDLADLVESDLVSAVSQARHERDNAISAAAVSESERLRLEQEAGELAQRQESADRISAQAANAASAYEKARKAVEKLPPAAQPHTLPCPYCDGPIVLHRDLAETRLEKFTGERLDDAELRRRRMAIADADGKRQHAEGQVAILRQDLSKARDAIDRAQRAKERLANWPRAVETGTDVDTASAALGRAEKRLNEFRAKQQAAEIHAKIEGNEIAIELLAGDGLRAKKLENVLGVFVRAQLQPLCEASRWGAVTIDVGGNIAYSGRAYALLSTSEQYRVRAILAVAMAQLDGSRLLVFDGADILDAPSRSGLFGLINAAGLPALVCMTAPRRGQVPDLAALGSGASYWLAGGVLEPLGPEQAAA